MIGCPGLCFRSSAEYPKRALHMAAFNHRHDILTGLARKYFRLDELREYELQDSRRELCKEILPS